VTAGKRPFFVELLSERHDRAAFACGNASLDKYLKTQAGQDMRRRVAVTFVLVSPVTSARILGYYTLCSTAIDLGEVAPAQRKKLPPYSILPATLIGRLARDITEKGRGLGEFLLIDALRRSWEQSKQIASFAVVVDAIDSHAYAWYAQKWQFISMESAPNRLYLPIKTIEKLFTD
jgi:hypothetical protein